MIAIITIVISVMTDQATGIGGPLRDSWASLQNRSQGEAETKINVVPSQPSVSVSPQVRITLANDGNFTPGQFSEWDLVLEMQTASGTSISYLSHTTAACPGTDQWSVRGIFADAATLTSEVVGPGLLGPGEEMVVILKPSTTTVESTVDRATFVAPNGITAQAIFKVATVLYVVDATDSMAYKYTEDGTFVSSTQLSALNGAAKGITTDLVSFWTVDNADDMVYEYTPSFVLSTTSALHASNVDAEGLTTDGCSSVWAVDHGASKKVFKYTLGGDYASNFDLTAANASSCASQSTRFSPRARFCGARSATESLSHRELPKTTNRNPMPVSDRLATATPIRLWTRLLSVTCSNTGELGLTSP